MANHCGFCDTRRPGQKPGYPYGTRMMFLGDQWFEFCHDCGNKEKVRNSETGEEITLHDLYDRLGAIDSDSGGNGVPEDD